MTYTIYTMKVGNKYYFGLDVWDCLEIIRQNLETGLNIDVWGEL